MEQVETQTNLVIYYNSEWVKKSFSYQADSVVVDEALYQVLKGTGLHYNRIDTTHYIILPQKRLNMSLPVITTGTGNTRKLRGPIVYGSKGRSIPDRNPS